MLSFLHIERVSAEERSRQELHQRPTVFFWPAGDIASSVATGHNRIISNMRSVVHALPLLLGQVGHDGLVVGCGLTRLHSSIFASQALT